MNEAFGSTKSDLASMLHELLERMIHAAPPAMQIILANLYDMGLSANISSEESIKIVHQSSET